MYVWCVVAGVGTLHILLLLQGAMFTRRGLPLIVYERQPDVGQEERIHRELDNKVKKGWREG